MVLGALAIPAALPSRVVTIFESMCLRSFAAALIGDQVWVATLRHGLLRRGADGTWTNLPKLRSAWLLFVGPDRAGTGAWVGAQGGVFHVATDGTIDEPAVTLPDVNVHVIVEDRDGLWIGTEGGLLHLRMT